MERRKSRKLYYALLLVALVLVITSVMFFVYPYESEEVLTGKGSWTAGDAYDFSSQKVYGNEDKRGDVFAIPIPGGQVGPGILPDAIIEKVNAIAIYDANTNTSIDCRKVNFDENLSSITIIQSGLLIPNRTVCINTEENEYAKMIFPGALGNFDWTLYRKQLYFGLLNQLKPNIIPDEILVKCEKNDDCILVQNSCNNCGCFDGKMKVINRNYTEYWNWYLENILKRDLKCLGGCRTSMSQDDSCSSISRCDQGKCIIDHIGSGIV